MRGGRTGRVIETSSAPLWPSRTCWLSTCMEWLLVAIATVARPCRRAGRLALSWHAECVCTGLQAWSAVCRDLLSGVLLGLFYSGQDHLLAQQVACHSV